MYKWVYDQCHSFLTNATSLHDMQVKMLLSHLPGIRSLIIPWWLQVDQGICRWSSLTTRYHWYLLYCYEADHVWLNCLLFLYRHGVEVIKLLLSVTMVACVFHTMIHLILPWRWRGGLSFAMASMWELYYRKLCVWFINDNFSLQKTWA